MRTEDLKHTWHDLKEKAMNYWHSLEFTREHQEETEAMEVKKHGEGEPMFDDFVSEEEKRRAEAKKTEEHHIDDIAGSE